MSDVLLTLLGVTAFAVGLLLSIALHEVGHLVPAKRFGIKVTQYMVGFGRTVWSTRRGETEYGFKAIPLGGYIRMIGMLPPEPGDDPRRLRNVTTGPIQSMVEDARTAAKLEILPGDEDRVFYRKPWWQKLIVMLGGPFMNVAIAVLLAAFVLIVLGVPDADRPQPVVRVVTECVLPADSTARSCPADADPSPAAAAGLLPGDRFVEVAGREVDGWDDVSQAIRSAEGRIDVVVERDGERLVLPTTLVQNTVYRESGDPDSGTVQAGFLGVSPTLEVVRQSPAEVAAFVGDFTVRTAQAVVSIPQKMVGVWQAAFGGEERDPEGPVGIVGVGRIGGEVAALDESATVRIGTFLLILASLNMALAVFNLIPLLPLDGGHAAGAVWEGIKRGYARVRGLPEPAPVDVARALPLAYGVATVLVAMSVLLLYADIVNPISLDN